MNGQEQRLFLINMDVIFLTKDWIDNHTKENVWDYFVVYLSDFGHRMIHNAFPNMNKKEALFRFLDNITDDMAGIVMIINRGIFYV